MKFQVRICFFYTYTWVFHLFHCMCFVFFWSQISKLWCSNNFFHISYIMLNEFSANKGWNLHIHHLILLVLTFSVLTSCKTLLPNWQPERAQLWIRAVLFRYKLLWTDEGANPQYNVENCSFSRCPLGGHLVVKILLLVGKFLSRAIGLMHLLSLPSSTLVDK